MTNTKNTKRALLASALSMLLCISMLATSTFAWFTDSASTAVNTIQSGKIDIRLVDSMTGEDIEGKSLKWIAADGNEDILWEPGATYYTQPVRVMNYSNLSFYMDAIVSGFSGDLELLEAIDFKIVHAYACLPASQGGKGLSFDQCSDRSYVYGGGESGDNIMADSMGINADWTDLENDYDNDGDLEAGPGVGEAKPLYDLCIIAKMKEDAGNEYQDMALTGAALVVTARQSSYEHDSYDSTYDADAEWPTVVNPSANPDSSTTITGTVSERMRAITDSTPTTITLASDLTIGSEEFDAGWLSDPNYPVGADKGYIFLANKNTNITLDLGGYTLTVNYTGGNYGATFGVDDGATLNIVNGTLVLNDDIVKYGCDLGEGSTFNIADSVTVVGTLDYTEGSLNPIVG